jgi:glycosyltransferase involved in cell wall biosynthesis
MVTTLQPESHVARFLLAELQKIEPVAILCEQDARNAEAPFEDVYQLWTVGSQFRAAILKTVRALGIRVLHIHHEFNMYGKLGLLEFPRLLGDLKKLGVRTLVTVHGVIPPDVIDDAFATTFGVPKFPLSSHVYRGVFGKFYRVLAKSADAIHVHSERSKRDLVDYYGARPDHVHVIPVGIPFSEPSSELPLAPWVPFVNESTLLFFGYVLPRKGLEVLIQAFARVRQVVPEARLIIAGGELPAHQQYAQSLRDLVSRSGLSDSIVFTGFISHTEMRWLYREAAAVVLPYTISVSSSLPLSFAVEARTPVIASDFEQFSEILREYRFGSLVKAGDATALGDACIKMLTDGEFRESCAAEAERCANDLSWANAAVRAHALYENLAS